MRVPPWLRISVSVAAVVLIIWRVPTTASWSAFGDVHGKWLWPAFASVLAMLAVRWLKWRQLFVTAGIPNLQRNTARSLFGGFALSVIAPGRLGEIGRYLFVPESDRPPTLLLTILDRALDLWALITYAVLSLLVVIPRPVGVFSVAIWLALVPIVVGLPRLISRMGGLLRLGENFRTQLHTAGHTLVTIRCGRFAALALVSTSLDLLTFFFLLRAFHKVDFVVVPATFPWIVMAAGLPIFAGGLGAREGAAAFLLAAFAIPSAAALDAALLFFALATLLPAAIGTIWLVATAHRQPSLGLLGLTRLKTLADGT